MQLLTTSWVVPVEGAPLRDGVVAVARGRIAWVGSAGDPGAPRGTLRDLGPGVLMPGLVNAHCHLELSHLRGRVGGSSGFVPWVESLVGLRAAEDREVVRAAAAEAIRSLVERGTVAVGDVSNRLEHLDLLTEAPLDAVVFDELIAWDPARADEVLKSAEARIADHTARLSSTRVELRLAAHAPYSVSAALLRGLAALGGPAELHLAESPAESRFLADGSGEWPAFLRSRGLGHVVFQPPGLSPTRYLDSLGALHPRLVAAHCVQVDAADIACLARRGVHVALCPRSNRNLGVGLPPVPELLAAGVRLCLGTDSLASVDSLDLMDDIAALHRELPSVAPEAILRMATRGGAEALGLTDLGTIAPGQRAALVHAKAGTPPEDPCAFLVSGQARLASVAP